MKTKIYKYSREEILKELNRFQCVGFTNCDPVHGLVARYKVNGDFNLDSVIKPMLLAKSTPKKKSKEIKQECEHHFKYNGGLEMKCTKCGKHINQYTPTPSLLNDIETIEEIEGMAIQTDGIQPEQVSNNDYFADLIGKLIKNQRILTKILNLLIKNK